MTDIRLPAGVRYFLPRAAARRRALAQRILAAPGSRDYGSFAVLHGLCVDSAELLELGPGGFFPQPKVHSSFIRIWPRTCG